MHEVIAPAGRILHSDIAIEHRKEKPGDPDRNLRIYQAMVDRGEALEPRAQYYYARELYYHAAYQQAADVFEAFLAEGRGWVENNIGACQDLSLCYHQLGKAAAYNEKAATYKPDDASVAYNRAYFAQKRAENAMAQRSAKESV